MIPLAARGEFDSMKEAVGILDATAGATGATGAPEFILGENIYLPCMPCFSLPSSPCHLLLPFLLQYLGQLQAEIQTILHAPAEM